jgi:hypothetical protein
VSDKYHLARDGVRLHPTSNTDSFGGYKMRPNWIAPVAFVLGLCCAPAWAITVEVVKGEVSVKQGEGFRKIAGPTEVYRGDKVMAAPGGQAKIVYADGCVVPVGPGGVATVGECKQPMTAGLEAPPPAVAAPIPWVPILLGAGVVAVGICAVSGCINDEDHGHRHHHRKDHEDSP